MSIVAPVVIACLVYSTFAAGPEIARFTPQAVTPGRTTILEFSGPGVKSATSLWTSFDAKARPLESTNDLARFEVTCPELPNGIHALQLVGPDGASDYQLVLVDSLPARSVPTSFQSLTNASPLTLPSTADSALKPEQSDFYRFRAEAGESISIEALAHRLGSEMDPVVRVLDTHGRELAFCDDEPGVWRDARFVFRAPLTADYIVEVHDAAYGGGNKFDYRLRVTREPLVWFTFPLIDPAEPAVPFEAVGAAQPPLPASPANPPSAPLLSAAGFLTEIEPNDLPEHAMTFVPGLVLNGRFEHPNDRDYFQFTLDKPAQLIFQSQTRALGSPCDLVLTLQQTNGTVIAASDSNRPADGSLTNRFTDPGTYLIEVKELTGDSLLRPPYRIKTFAFRPGVRATAENNRLTIKPGGTITLKVAITRYDYPGDVQFSLDPPLAGIELEGDKVKAGKNDAELTFKASNQAAAGQLQHFRLRFSSGQVSTAPALRKSFPLMLNVPAALDGLFSIAVTN